MREVVLNHRWFLGENGEVTSKAITLDMLDRTRSVAATLPISRWQLRSCWDCNSAHARFLSDGGMGTGWGLHCIGCGRWFFDDVDITEYDEAALHAAAGGGGER